MQVQVAFTKTGSNSALGNFGPGQTARVSHEFARHLVEEARVARYVEGPTHAPESAPTRDREQGPTRRTRSKPTRADRS